MPGNGGRRRHRHANSRGQNRYASNRSRSRVRPRTSSRSRKYSSSLRHGRCHRSHQLRTRDRAPQPELRHEPKRETVVRSGDRTGPAACAGSAAPDIIRPIPAGCSRYRPTCAAQLRTVPCGYVEEQPTTLPFDVLPVILTEHGTPKRMSGLVCASVGLDDSIRGLEEDPDARSSVPAAQLGGAGCTVVFSGPRLRQCRSR